MSFSVDNFASIQTESSSIPMNTSEVAGLATLSAARGTPRV